MDGDCGVDRYKILRLRDRPILPLIAASFFVLTFAIKAFTDGPYVRGEVSSAVAYSKYFTALVACLAALAYMLKGGETKFVAEFNKLMMIAVVFCTVSLVLQLMTGRFSATVFMELFKFIMPIVLAYCILNALDDREVWGCMVCVLAVSLTAYFFELRSQDASFASFFSADFEDFNSETESSGFAEIALMLVFYFAYMKKSKMALAVSAIFSILAFKRLAMIVTLVVLFLCIFAPKTTEGRVPRKLVVALKALTILVAMIWVWLLLPEQELLFADLFGKFPSEFTMGRSDTLRYLYLGDFHSYGYGSANETVNAVFGVPFEMDLAKIAIELTPIVAIVFVWLFWDLAGDSFWGVVIIGYYMINMITSDSLNSNFAFTLAYIVIGTVGYRHKSAKGQFDHAVDESKG